MRLDHLLFKENQKALWSHDKNSGLSKESPEGVSHATFSVFKFSKKALQEVAELFYFGKER